MRGYLKFILIFFLFLLPWSANGLAQEEEERIEAFVSGAQNALSDDQFQTELPGTNESLESPFDFDIPDWVGTAILVVIIGTIVVILGLFIYTMAKYFYERYENKPAQKDRKEAPVRVVQKRATQATPLTLKDVEALEAKGHFTEAIHCLLLIAIDRLFIALRSTAPKASTSREILTDKRIRDIWKKDLEILVRAVEEALFGGKAPDRKGYIKCREIFENLNNNLRVPS